MDVMNFSRLNSGLYCAARHASKHCYIAIRVDLQCKILPESAKKYGSYALKCDFFNTNFHDAEY